MLHSQIKGPKETREKQSDLIWFDYETRLRTLVEELLEPTLRRSREERELFEILSKKNDQLGKRLDDVEFMFQKTQKRQTAFEDIFKRIHDLDVSRKAEDKGLSDRIDNIKKNMEELNTDMFLLRERMTEVERRGEKLSGEFVTTTDHLAEYRTKLSKVVDDLDQTWKTQVEDQQNSNKEIFSKLQHTNEKLTELADSIKNNGHQLETAHKNIEQLNSKTLTLDSKIAKSTEQLEGYSHQASFLATFKPRLDSLEKQICTNEKYIEQYLPLYLQIQIAETVQGSLHPNDIKRHASHEQKLFQELVESLKTAEAPNLSKKIEYVHEALDPVVKKYSQEAARGKKNDGGITRSADFQLGVEEEHHEEAVDYRLIAELNRKISQIQTENERSLKECKDEFSRRFLMYLKKHTISLHNFLFNSAINL